MPQNKVTRLPLRSGLYQSATHVTGMQAKKARTDESKNEVLGEGEKKQSAC